MLVERTLFLLVGLVVGTAATFGLLRRFRRRSTTNEPYLARLLRWHLGNIADNAVCITERSFPIRVRVDLQQALESEFREPIEIVRFHAVRGSSHETLTISDCLNDQYDRIRWTPTEYEEVDIGESEPARVLKNGLWLLRQGGLNYVVLLTPSRGYCRDTGIDIQVAAPNTAEGIAIGQRLFDALEAAVAKGVSYRGKILSLEQTEHDYSGQSRGITVHKLRQVARDEVILPAATLDLLERNVIRFVQQRPQLARFGQSTRKGILFYGPPGTGKTHTIHYLARALPGHTTLIISAEQVGLLGEYMTLARLLQPATVVIEDVDLIARDRESMNSAGEEVLLNKLLNEMDGLKESAEILFLLTTNRPAALEAALAARPGRIDQAIEFPPPDEPGRAKLIRLYAPQAPLPEDVISNIVRRTQGVSGAFIKELMRRIFQSYLERGGTGDVIAADTDQALDEMLFAGGSLNRQLLGAGTAAKS